MVQVIQREPERSGLADVFAAIAPAIQQYAAFLPQIKAKQIEMEQAAGIRGEARDFKREEATKTRQVAIWKTLTDEIVETQKLMTDPMTMALLEQQDLMKDYTKRLSDMKVQRDLLSKNIGIGGLDQPPSFEDTTDLVGGATDATDITDIDEDGEDVTPKADLTSFLQAGGGYEPPGVGKTAGLAGLGAAAGKTILPKLGMLGGGGTGVLAALLGAPYAGQFAGQMYAHGKAGQMPSRIAEDPLYKTGQMGTMPGILSVLLGAKTAEPGPKMLPTTSGMENVTIQDVIEAQRRKGGGGSW